MSESEKPPGAFTTQFAERKEWKIDAGLWAAITATIPQAARVIDLGAGVGKYVKALQDRGNAAVGVDGIPDVGRLSGSLVMPWNLTKPLPFAPMSDWVLCIETGEHIPKEGEAGLLENIAGHATVGAIVSWATPGQRGRDHINCQPPEYITAELTKRGLTLNSEATTKARKAAGKGWDHKLLVFDGQRVTALKINIPLGSTTVQVKATPLEAVGTNLKVHYQASQCDQGNITAATVIVTEGQAVDRGAFWRAWRQVGGMGQGIVGELPDGREVEFIPPV